MMGRPSAMAQNWPMNNGLGNFSQPARFCGIWDQAEIYLRPMSANTHTFLEAALLHALRPLARIMLKCGVGFRDFSEVAKTAFVDVATSDFGLRGRPTNVSRVAVMTGLTRKEVRRIRDTIEQGNSATPRKGTPLSEILERWHSEPEFLDSNGQPRRLSFSGDSASFSELVRRFGGDIPPGAMRTELKRIGAITETEDGSLVARRQSVRSPQTDEMVVRTFERSVYPLLASINASLEQGRNSDEWPQATAYTTSVDADDLPRLRRVLEERVGETIDSINDLLGTFEKFVEQNGPSKKKGTVAVGAFYYEEGSRDVA